MSLMTTPEALRASHIFECIRLNIIVAAVQRNELVFDATIAAANAHDF
jgi:hypothetical protein